MRPPVPSASECACVRRPQVIPFNLYLQVTLKLYLVALTKLLSSHPAKYLCKALSLFCLSSVAQAELLQCMRRLLCLSPLFTAHIKSYVYVTICIRTACKSVVQLSLLTRGELCSVCFLALIATSAPYIPL